MKTTTAILIELYEFAKENKISVKSISAHKYEDLEEFSVSFERGGEE